MVFVAKHGTVPYRAAVNSVRKMSAIPTELFAVIGDTHARFVSGWRCCSRNVSRVPAVALHYKYSFNEYYSMRRFPILNSHSVLAFSIQLFVGVEM